MLDIIENHGVGDGTDGTGTTWRRHRTPREAWWASQKNSQSSKMFVHSDLGAVATRSQRLLPSWLGRTGQPESTRGSETVNLLANLLANLCSTSCARSSANWQHRRRLPGPHPAPRRRCRATARSWRTCTGVEARRLCLQAVLHVLPLPFSENTRKGTERQ